jgi:hypothetical protein
LIVRALSVLALRTENGDYMLAMQALEDAAAQLISVFD